MSDRFDDELERELESLLRHGISIADRENVAGWKLLAIARRRLPLKVRSTAKETLRTLFRHVIEKIEDDRRRQALQILLNTEHYVEYDERLKRAADALALSWQTLRTSSKQRGLLLSELKQGLARLEEDDGRRELLDELFRESGPRSFVGRRQLRRRAVAALNSRFGVVALVGQPGTGKSVLARNVAEQFGEKFLELDATTPEVLDAEIRQAVLNLGGDSERGSLSQLTQLSEAEEGPSVILLDNLTDPTLLKSLISRRTKSKVIVTATTDLGLTEEVQIEVGSLTQAEGAELAMQLADRISLDEARRLSDHVDGHALAIVAACGLLGIDTNLTVSSLCSSMARTGSRVLDGGLSSHTTLSRIYQQLLTRVAQESPQAATVLLHAALLAPLRIPATVLQHSLSAAEGVRPDDARLLMIGAVRTLRRSFLIDISDTSYLKLHTLTRSMVRDSAGGGWSAALRPLLVGLHAWCREVRELVPDAPADRLLAFHSATIEHVRTAAMEPGVVLAEIDDISSSWGTATQFVAKMSGVDRRHVLPLMIADGPDRYHCMITIIDEDAISRDPVEIQFQSPLRDREGEIMWIQVPSWKDGKRAPILLFEYRSDSSWTAKIHLLTAGLSYPNRELTGSLADGGYDTTPDHVDGQP